MMLPPPTGFGRQGHAATGVVVAARHCCVTGSCVAADAIASVLDMTGRSPDAMVMPPDIEVQILRYYHAEKARPRRSISTCPPACGRATRRCGRMHCKPMTSSRTLPMTDPATLRARAGALHLHGLLAHWPEAATSDWVASLLDWEEQKRSRRSLERRLKDARIGRFKPLCDFDWAWPKRCDRAALEALMALDFLEDAGNVVLVGPNGVGKSTLAQNIAHQALIAGHTVLFTSAGQLLGDLCALDSDAALRRRLRYYARPQLLVIDEVGYLSYSNRHADLMFELVSRRYQKRSTRITTNRPFAEWREVFPNAACVVSLIDRLVHNAEIIAIEGDSYRLKEARERNEQRSRQRRGSKA
jgi:DNA replication protein DnaC